FRILAVKEMISRPKAYGYRLRPQDLYPPIPTYTVNVDSSITDLAQFAISQGSTYKILKVMNPWLLKATLTNPDHKQYVIQFPRKGVKLYGMEEEVDVVTAPDDTTRFVTKTEILADSLTKPVIHVVKAGDTWESIAKTYDVDEDLLLEW